MERKARSIAKPQGAGRMMAAALLLLTLLFQSYATQTHIHPLKGIPGLTELQMGAPAPHQPAGTADADCAVCQMAHAGQFVAPHSPLLFIVQLAVSAIETVLGRLPHYETASHDWRGRAPPSP